MSMKRFSVAAVLTVGLALTGCGFGTGVSDETPDTPKKISKKYTDERRCEKRKGTRCTKWDDKDWIFVTSDGSQWDVEEKEYNEYKVGDYWPR